MSDKHFTWIEQQMPYEERIHGNKILRLTDAVGDTRYTWRNGKGHEVAWLDSAGRAAFRMLQSVVDPAVAGWVIAPKTYGWISKVLSATGTQAVFGAPLTLDSTVVLAGKGQTEYVQIGARASSGGLPGHMHIPDTNPSGAYTLVRDVAGTGALHWAAGTMWFEVGLEGDYWIELRNTPEIRLALHTLGASLSAVATYFNVGDMNGLFGVSGVAHGVGIGDYDSGDYIRFTNTAGLEVGASVSVVGIMEYADNAAAVAAGLTAGALYRTGDVLKIVH